MNHCVSVVGLKEFFLTLILFLLIESFNLSFKTKSYGTDDATGKNYWILRNSWGSGVYFKKLIKTFY
jgi:hypothetical protein